MADHVITFSPLDARSIDKAIKELNKYTNRLMTLSSDLIRELTDRGIEVTKRNIVTLGAVRTGELLDSVNGIFNEQERVGIIRTDAYHALYVEYGTGVTGARSPHPEPWAYDVNQHGDTGWWYLDGHDGQYHWTKGMPSRPFFWNMRNEIMEIAPQLAATIYGKL